MVGREKDKLKPRAFSICLSSCSERSSNSSGQWFCQKVSWQGETGDGGMSPGRMVRGRRAGQKNWVAEILQDPDKGKPSARDTAEILRDKTNVSLWGPGSSLLNIPQGSS